ncbi:MAG: NAD(P)-dependent oxidoreductase [Vicingaceae bacterium]
MKIGIIREGKTPPDKRVPFTPKQAAEIQQRAMDAEVLIQKSEVRAFADEDYVSQGLKLVDNLEDCDLIFGVKEVNLEDLLPNKTYFFFSHTIKEQAYNRDLLRTVLERNIQLVDYECLTKPNGQRILGFGRYAGIVGCYNGFLAFGERSERYQLKAAHACEDRAEMEAQLPQIKLPSNFKIALTGFGRVAGGAIEILEKVGIRKVEPQAYLKQDFTEPVYTQLSVEEYFRKKDGSDFDRQEVFNHPERFESDFFKYAAATDLYIACHFWDSNGPNIFEKEDLKSAEFRIRTLADISCDIAGPIPTTLRPSTIAEPIYQVHRQDLKEVDEVSDKTVTVMAVDNLPCELPKDASEDFGEELIDKVVPCLFGGDPDRIIERATIAYQGKLMPDFQYLEDYVKGKE